MGTSLAPYACHPSASRGRLHAEPGSAIRSIYQRDRDRVIHSTAFRRLKHKTQVFVYHEGDHYRTRLTHSLEVAQIARTLARALGLDEDLAEALALAHDLGHTPFGHAGERAMAEVMAPYGGFDHNAQSLRVVTRLERRYAAFDGLNLAWETLEGIVKHNGPLIAPNGAALPPHGAHGLPHAIRAYALIQDLRLASFPSLEAQIAALSDDIAYNAHDIDDGLRAGLFAVSDLREVPLVGSLIRRVEASYPGLQQSRLVHETLRRLISDMVDGLLGETRERLKAADPRSCDAVREAASPLAAFPPKLRDEEAGLKAFLAEHMYRAPRVAAIMAQAEGVLKDLFAVFMQRPDEMRDEWSEEVAELSNDALARRVCDYIAGMTDRYALATHERLFDDTPDLR
jgi:dGTPase